MSHKQHLAAALRRTLQTIEQSEDVYPDGPEFAELKRIILLRIAELEEGSAATQSWTNVNSQPVSEDAA